ncbi:MAG: YncE family protein [Methylococcales bacterium]|jgi:DNA-binding beta-propeller fold protein YncE|nr:YncE family protein [Methylococcales bacterium]
MLKKTITNTLCSLILLAPLASFAEMLAMVNYESQPNQTPRKEGIAIIDVDPNSANFGKVMNDLPLPPDAVAHHIFYNKDLSKAYITALGKGALRVINMNQEHLKIQDVNVPECQVGEDMSFSSDKKTWYLTCMGSSNVIVGNAQTDQVKQVIAANGNETFIKYPHGIGLNEDIDRIMVTSTVRASDLGDAGDTVTIIKASTGEVLSTHKVGGPGSSTVEAVFIPHSTPPMAYVNTMFEGKLWVATWQSNHDTFDFKPAYDFSEVKQGVPLEIYFNQEHDKLFVTTAKPGALNIFDISQSKTQPKLIKSIPTAGGAHHVVFSPDEKYAIVQNSFLNLPEMDDGSISVINLETMEKIRSIDTLKKQGFKPNCIVMMPKWHTDDVH